MEIEWNNTYSSFNVYFLKIYNIFWLVSSVAQLCWTLYNSMDCSTPDFPVLHHLPEFAQTHVHWVGDAIQPSCPCHSLLLLLNFPSIEVFSRESAIHFKLPKYWSFSFSITSSNQYSELISFRIDRLNLLEVQGTLKSLLQHQKHQVQKHQVFSTQLSL